MRAEGRSSLVSEVFVGADSPFFVEQSTAYWLMICLWFFPWLLKITVSYGIWCKPPGINVGNYYKKHKTSFFRRFFYVDLKHRIRPGKYYWNMISGVILLVSAAASVIYLCLAIFGYTLKLLFIPYFAGYATLMLAVIRAVYGLLDRIDDKDWLLRKK